MKQTGLTILIGGFFWLMFDALSSFASYQHRAWILQSKDLPVEDQIPRDRANSSMRELSLDLKNRHRIIVIPATLMLLGGLLIHFAPAESKKPE